MLKEKLWQVHWLRAGAEKDGGVGWGGWQGGGERSQ